jgi:hypothetical protein
MNYFLVVLDLKNVQDIMSVFLLFFSRDTLMRLLWKQIIKQNNLWILEGDFLLLDLL